LASLLDVVEGNAQGRGHIAIFEIAPIFLEAEEGPLPDEVQRLVIALSGERKLRSWQESDTAWMDFYDMKGIVASLLDGLKLDGLKYDTGQHPVFHPGKSARILVGDRQVGVFGELHPQVKAQYNFADAPVLAATFDILALLETVPQRHEAQPVSAYPPILEDLALVVDENLPAANVAAMIAQTGGKLVTTLSLFDIYRGDQIGKDKKSLAYSLTYQAADRTLTDEEVAKVRNKIVKRLEKELGAKLRE
jgi:phenylalanyl-tRNA synthetase beta chain